MGEAIRVDVTRTCDLSEVDRYLVECGFATSLVEGDDTPALDVTDPRAAHADLDADVWNALTAWLAVTERPLVPRRVAEGEFALTPAGE